MRLRANVMYVFLPQVFRAFLGLALLPFTTIVLDAEDFGLFAFYTAVSNFCAGLVVSGVMYSLSNDFLKITDEQKKKVVTSLVCFGFLFSFFLSMLVVPSLYFLSDVVGEIGEVRALYVVLVLLGIFFSPVWVLASCIITVESKFQSFAVVSVTETVVANVVTVVALFVLSVGQDALFYGAITSTISSFFGAMWVLRKRIALSVEREFLKKHTKTCIRSLPSSVMEKVRNPLQNIMFARYVGPAFVGIFNHSLQYQNMTRMMVKAVTNVLWRPALNEARDGGDFRDVLKSWQCVYFLLTVLGVFFATVGRDLIGFLTNYKMMDAHWLAAIWMTVLLVECTGRAEIAVIYDKGLVAASEGMLLISFSLSLLCLLILVPVWGVEGGVVSALVSPLFHRLMLIVYARRLFSAPFLEWTAALGGLAVGFSLLLVIYLQPSASTNVFLFALFSGVAVMLFHSYLLWGARQLVPQLVQKVFPIK